MEREGGRTEKKKKKSISLVKTRQELFREEGGAGDMKYEA